MVRSVRLAAGLAGILVPLVACSLIVDTGGLGDAAAAADATTDTPVADARTNDDDDADASGDAAKDAPTDAPDAAVKCIDGPTRFCDDFDSPSPGSKWSSVEKKRGEVTFEDVGLSAPRAMHATVSAGGGYGGAQLIQSLTGNPPTVHCELDMKLDGILPTGETDILSFTTNLGAVERHSVYLANFDGTWMLAEYAADPDGGAPLDRMISLGAALPNATWFHVVMDVNPTSASLTANGAFIKLTGLSTPSGTEHWLHVGVTYTTSNVPSAGVYVDNVDCNLVP